MLPRCPRLRCRLPQASTQRSELIGVANLPELVALSSVVVEGRVSSIELGPDLSDGEGLGYLRVTIEVSHSYEGSWVGTQVSFLTFGYEPKDGSVVQAGGERWAPEGSTRMWFLHPSELPKWEAELFVATSAGQCFRGARR